MESWEVNMVVIAYWPPMIPYSLGCPNLHFFLDLSLYLLQNHVSIYTRVESEQIAFYHQNWLQAASFYKWSSRAFFTL